MSADDIFGPETDEERAEADDHPLSFVLLNMETSFEMLLRRFEAVTGARFQITEEA
jgi:hypothetical protein